MAEIISLDSYSAVRDNNRIARDSGLLDEELPNVCKCGAKACIVIGVAVFCEMCNDFKGVL